MGWKMHTASEHIDSPRADCAILVIDDEEYASQRLADLAGQISPNVTVVGSIELAIDRLSRGYSYDLIILDEDLGVKTCALTSAAALFGIGNRGTIVVVTETPRPLMIDAVRRFGVSDLAEKCNVTADWLQKNLAAREMPLDIAV